MKFQEVRFVHFPFVANTRFITIENATYLLYRKDIVSD